MVGNGNLNVAHTQTDQQLKRHSLGPIDMAHVGDTN